MAFWGQKHASFCILFLHQNGSHQAHPTPSPPLTSKQLCPNRPIRAAICFIIFINDVPFLSVTSTVCTYGSGDTVHYDSSKCGIPSGVSHMEHWQATEVAQAPANFQQFSQPGPCVVTCGTGGARESIGCESPYGISEMQGKVCTVQLGTAFKGKWMNIQNACRDQRQA